MSDPKFPDVEVQLIGEDGNAFFIMGRVSKALKRAGHREAAEQFSKEIFACGSYDEVLRLCMNTVKVA